MRLRDVNWLGDIAISEAIDRHAEIYVKVRSTRAPQAAWLHRYAEADFEVELIGGEDGVSPGQACVFYDAADGQARVLGGGIIASTVQSAQAASHATAVLAGAR